MKFKKFPFFEKFKKYHFEIKHLLVVLFVLIFFQILVSLVHKSSLQNLLIQTQDWYQQDSAERLANLSATSLELLLETTGSGAVPTSETAQEIVQAFNIILNQPLLQKSVRDICVLVSEGEHIYAIDDGRILYQYFFEDHSLAGTHLGSHVHATQLYQDLKEKIINNEQIYSIREGEETFHVFVPFVPKGEFVGAVYIKNTPDFTFITREIISSYDETAMIFAALILLGLLAMFYISSYTVKERDEAQEQLFKEREKFLTEQIHHQKEALFTKRIYHTHHKAEKIMGFIKEDLRMLGDKNIEDVKYRVTKYANFISRVIYDMKWYDPPMHTIRNPHFRTDLNEVICFLVQHLFLRISNKTDLFEFKTDLDENLPPVPINEFVVWEILEPLLQNSIDHAGDRNVIVSIRTNYDPTNNRSQILIEDNGNGIPENLLKTERNGVKKIFLENISTKSNGHNSGYGCYLAYEISRQRCGWQLNADNLPSAGCRFTITIPANK